MDPNRKITKKFTKKFDSKVINRQYFHRKTGLKLIKNLKWFCNIFNVQPYFISISATETENWIQLFTTICA